MRKIVLVLLALLTLCSCQKNHYSARITDLRLVSVEPGNAYPGDLVTIFGWNFSPVQEENAVSVDGVPATVLEAASSRIQIILPANEPGKRRIKVKSPSGESDDLEITYLARPEHDYLVSTIVGQQGQRKCVDGVGTEALTYMPTGISKAPDGTLWFTDRGGNKLRRIAPDMTVSSEMDAAIANAALWQGCFDGNGNYWCTDKANGILYRYEPSSGKTVTVATGMKSPMNVVMDSEGNFLVPARDEKCIYKFTPSGEKSVFAEVAEGPSFIAIDPKGNVISSTHNGYCLLSINPVNKSKTVILGDGEKGSALYNGVAGDPLTAKINSCHGIDFDSKGRMYISDATFHAIRLLTPDKNGDYSKGKLETILGGVKGYTDGSGLKVKFNEPAGVLVYDDETLYVCDVQNCLIRKVTVR